MLLAPSPWIHPSAVVARATPPPTMSAVYSLPHASASRPVVLVSKWPLKSSVGERLLPGSRPTTLLRPGSTSWSCTRIPSSARRPAR